MTRIGWIGLVALLASGCENSHEPRDLKPTQVEDRDALVQYSLVAALAAGDYADGEPLRNVLAGGDFGVGTFDRLDGEMIVLDGQMYQALADGTIRSADLDGGTPFAAVTFFGEDGRMEHMAAASLDDLDEQLDRLLPRRNSPYAIRIDSEFKHLTLRSVPAQTPPFQPLVDVVKNQMTFRHSSVRGMLVGLRCPNWVGTLNVAGYHWHFLSDDRKIGGHVLACEFSDACVQFDECDSLVIQIPRTNGFEEFDAATVNATDIEAIERQRSGSRRP